MERRVWRRWLAATCYGLGVLFVVGGAALGDAATFLLGPTLLTVALVLANW